MKIKNLIVLLLLLMMSTSVLAEHLFNAYKDSSCVSSTHTSMVKDSLSLDDSSCELHCELHHVYLLPIQTKLPLLKNISSLVIKQSNSYFYQDNLKFFKPPIS